MRLRGTRFLGAFVILSLTMGGEQGRGPAPNPGVTAEGVRGDGARVAGARAPQDTARASRDSARASQDTAHASQDTTSARPPPGVRRAGGDTAGAQLPGDTLPRGTLPQDTVARDTLRGDTAGVAGAAADSVGGDTARAVPPGLRLGLARVPYPLTPDLISYLPDIEAQRPELRPRVRNWGDAWAERVRHELAAAQEALWRGSLPALTQPAPEVAAASDTIGPASDTVGVALDTAAARVDTTLAARDTSRAPVTPGAAGEEEILPDVLSQYADLGISLQGRVEMGGGWNRFRPCDVNIQFNCNPGLFPNLQPDIQFGARVGGTISDRVHVNVDYDNRREFDAANNINVYYQGLEDEILQRVEVGDVSFQLPNSQYLTQGIPAGNFGFRATGQMGPIDFQTVWAQQKGDLQSQELELGGGGQGLEQQATTVLDDADYERGRFYFLFDPQRLPNYPHIDIQRLLAQDAPPEIRPASTVKVYRYEAFTFGINNQIPEGFINAVAVAADTFQTPAGIDTVVTDTLSGFFRPLVEGEDYTLHRSGLWIQLKNTLSDREGLAITYRAADGTEIGTFNAEQVNEQHNANPDQVPPPVLELIKGVNSRPGTATWDREMHNIYRVSASPGVVRSSIQLTISQGEPELGNTFRTTPGGTQLEFLKIFGLDDDPTDNQVDGSGIYESQSSSGSADNSGPLGTYIVFPTLEPFKTPPPLRDVSTALNGKPFPLDAGDRNAAIYDEPTDQVRRGANLYRLTIQYRQRFEGYVSTIALGSGGVREGSEKVYIDNQQLVRGQDYTVDYDVGQIELTNPDQWFRNNPNARIRVSFEQKPLFQLAPTTVFGLQAHYGLGDAGELNFIGLSQTEKTLQTRPELGLEPSAVRLAGVSGRLNFQPRWLTHLVDALPAVQAEAPSSITLDGELAMSMPTTNTKGQTYVEDFEGGPGNQIQLTSRAWRLGAAPGTSAGAEMVAPPVFNESDAAELVWQDQYVVDTKNGPQVIGGLCPTTIDNQIRLQNSSGQCPPEPVLFMTLRRPEHRTLTPDPNASPGPAWRSITSVISPQGQDFTAIEFLEFYVAVPDVQADSVSLIFDLGTVSEDAFGIDTLGIASGIGRLDREVDPPRIWGPSDDTGLWGTGCQGERGERAFPLGDVRANCTRGNGLEDSEDINQNGVLDTEERYFRYVVRVGDPNNRYFVRDAQSFSDSRFRLFRIPLRQPDYRERASDAEFQNIRHLRITVVSKSDVPLVLARMRFLGSRWLKRGRTGVVTGLADTTSSLTPDAAVEVGPISTTDDRYVSPPGVTDQVANQSDQFQIGNNSINEQSLKIRANRLGPGERAEVYLQYPQTPRDFLAYRSLQGWALAADGPWGKNGAPLRFFVKLGEDARNFYLYRTPLHKVAKDARGADLRQAWLPQLDIDFERFIALRSKAEEILLKQGGLPPDSTLTVWDVDVFPDGDSSYAVVIAQRSRAPNLAAIRQISLGVYNEGGTTVDSSEVWVDDLRLGSAVDNMGLVGQVNLNVRGSDVWSFSASYSSRNPYFRQLGDQPQFQSSGQLGLAGQMQFGRFLPRSWGVDMPLSVSYNRSGSDPVLLARTDVEAGRLPGLRVPRSKDFRADMRLAKRTPTDAPWASWLLDNSSFRLGYNQSTRQNSRSFTDVSGVTAGYSYRSNIADLSFPLLPGPLNKLFFFLPNAIADSRVRLTPQSLQLSTSYVNTESNTRRFQEIIQLPGDSSADAIQQLDRRLQSNATIMLEPLTALSGQFTYAQDRDLAPTKQLVDGRRSRRLINARRFEFGGLDLGWETARALNTNLTYRPNIAPWLAPRATFDSRFRFDRNASYITEQGGDTVLTRDFNSSRSVNTSAAFNLPVLLRSAFGRETGGLPGLLLGLMDRLDVFSANWSRTLLSYYYRDRASPSLRYQFGLGGFDAFRVQDGDTASRVTQNEALTLSSGVQLPLGMALNADYTQTDANSWTPNNRSQGHSVTWPNLRLNWSRVPLPPIFRRWVQTLGVRTGLTLREDRDVILGVDQTRTANTRTIPFSVNFSFTTGWALGYNLDLEKTERRDPTGISRGKNINHSVQLTARFSPLSSGGSFNKPIRASLRYTRSDRTECRQLGLGLGGGGPTPQLDCEPFTDLNIQRVEMTVDTDLQPFVLGLQGTWRDQQSNIGERPGSTQLEITLFGQFLFQTGVIR